MALVKEEALKKMKAAQKAAQKPEGISPQTWRAYQKGKASPDKVRKIEARNPELAMRPAVGPLDDSFEPSARGLLKELRRPGPLPAIFGDEVKDSPLSALSKPEGISPQTWRSFTKGNVDSGTRRKVLRRLGR